MKDIKLIFFDIDGTLVNPRTRCIPESTKEALVRLHRNGIKLCIATGRPPASLPDLTGIPFDAFLTINGSLCYTPDRIISHIPIDPADVQQVISNAAAIGRPVSIAVRERLAANGWEEDLAEYYRMAGLVLRVSEDFDETCREDVYQIMLGCRVSDHPAIIRDTDHVSITYAWEHAADVIHSSSGKGEAIGHILDYFHLQPSDAMAFGDGHNDIQMLQKVGHSVAMGNGADAVKAIASDVCGAVWDDGIYYYCLNHGLI